MSRPATQLSREEIAIHFSAALLNDMNKEHSTKSLNEKAFQLADSFIKASNNT